MTQNEVEYSIEHIEGNEPIQVVNNYVTDNNISIISKVFDGTHTPFTKLIGTKDEDIQAHTIRPVFFVRTKDEKIDKYKIVNHEA